MIKKKIKNYWITSSHVSFNFLLLKQCLHIIYVHSLHGLNSLLCNPKDVLQIWQHVQRVP